MKKAFYSLAITTLFMACVLRVSQPSNSTNNTPQVSTTPIASAEPVKKAPAGSLAKGESCGGKRGLVCGEGLFCELPAGDGCKSPDMMGTCADQPKACTREFKPVCGCDGKTYGNDCTRRAAGVSLARVGACEGQAIPAPSVGKTKGEMCGGVAGIKCAQGLFCNMTEADGLSCTTADRAGTCDDQPTMCTREFKPVCGCDGKTYGNDCERRAAGVTRASQGACVGNK